jgi:CHASE2 domain-containing sensor protein
VKFKRPKLTPLLIALSVLALVCGVRALRLDFPERLERMTYDLRVRAARHFPAPVATNLAFVSIEESSIKAVQSGKLGYRFGLLWPRQVYGRLVDELSAQGAAAVGFDVLFGERRPTMRQCGWRTEFTSRNRMISLVNSCAAPAMSSSP